jgi:hypothetical protein
LPLRRQRDGTAERRAARHETGRYTGTLEPPARFVQLWTERLAGPVEVEAVDNRFLGSGEIGLPP